MAGMEEESERLFERDSREEKTRQRVANGGEMELNAHPLTYVVDRERTCGGAEAVEVCRRWMDGVVVERR